MDPKMVIRKSNCSRNSRHHQSGRKRSVQEEVFSSNYSAYCRTSLEAFADIAFLIAYADVRVHISHFKPFTAAGLTRIAERPRVDGGGAATARRSAAPRGADLAQTRTFGYQWLRKELSGQLGHWSPRRVRNTRTRTQSSF